MARNTPLVNSSQLSQLCPLQTSFPAPAYLLRVQSEKQQRHWCCAITVQQQLKHWYAINTVLVTDIEHSAILAAMKHPSHSQYNLLQYLTEWKYIKITFWTTVPGQCNLGYWENGIWVWKEPCPDCTFGKTRYSLCFLRTLIPFQSIVDEQYRCYISLK